VADSVLPSQSMDLPESTAVSPLAKVISVPNPVYTGKSAGVSGTVVLQLLLDKSGHVTNLKVVSGPEELQEAAMNTVKKWKYKPYLLNGKPHEISVTVRVIFGPTESKK